MTNTERKQLVRYLRQSFRALLRAQARIERMPEYQRPSDVTLLPGFVVTVDAPPPPGPAMPPPACLITPDTQAGIERFTALMGVE